MNPEIIRKKLKNGLLVLAEYLPNLGNFVAICVTIKAGSVYESEKSSGIAHFIEHLAFKSQGKRSFEEVIKAFEYNGFDFLAGTGYDTIEFTAEGPPEKLVTIIEELYLAIKNRKYDLSEVRNDKKQILGEIFSSRDDIFENTDDRLFGLLSKGSSFNRPILGTSRSVRFLSRKKIADFKKTYFRPNNIIVGVCGEFNEQELFKTIGKTFGRLKRKEVPLPEIKNPVLSADSVHLIKRKEIKSGYLCFAYLLPGLNHVNAIEFRLLRYILCGGLSSMLYLELMQKRGIGYDISGGIENCGDFSVLSFYTQVANPKRIFEAKRLFFEEIKKIQNLSAEDFEGYKNGFAFDFKKNVLRHIEERVKKIVTSEIEKWPYDFREIPEIVSKITFEEFQEVVQKYLIDNPYVLLAVVPKRFRISKKKLKN